MVHRNVRYAMTERECAIVSAYTGILCGKFEWLHAYADEHFPGITTMGLAFNSEKLKEKAYEDFINLGPK
jgi:hypothetical protein